PSAPANAAAATGARSRAVAGPVWARASGAPSPLHARVTADTRTLHAALRCMAAPDPVWDGGTREPRAQGMHPCAAGERHAAVPPLPPPGRLARLRCVGANVPRDALYEGRPRLHVPRVALHRPAVRERRVRLRTGDRKSTRLNSSHVKISYAVFCLKKKKE